MSVEFKRGATFDFSGPFTVTVDGVALSDLTGWTGKCEIRTDNGELVASPTFTWVNAATRIGRLRAVDTEDWPLGPVFLDIRLTSPTGDVVPTSTTRMEIVREVTRA